MDDIVSQNFVVGEEVVWTSEEMIKHHGPGPFIIVKAENIPSVLGQRSAGGCKHISIKEKGTNRMILSPMDNTKLAVFSERWLKRANT